MTPGLRPPSIDPADVLALLEDGPKPQRQLVEWLGCSAPELARAMRALKREGRVRRVGTRQDWALADFTTHAGRRPTLDREACRQAIEAVVAPGPMTTTEIITRSGLSRRSVNDELRVLQQASRLKRFGRSNVTRWVVASYVTPPEKPPRPKKRRPDPVASSPVPLDDVAGWDADSECVEDSDKDDTLEIDADGEPQVAARVGRPRASAARLRQERRTTATVPLDGPPAWWASAPRAGFTALSEQQHGARMKGDPINRFVKPPMLGSRLP